MKALQYKQYGGLETLELNPDASVPTPGNGQVVVAIHAASINPIDWKVREGYMKDYISLTFPVTIGGNFSGIVTQLGEGVTELKVGDEVFGQALVLNGGSGSMAEFAVSNEANTVEKPTNVTHIEASSLPLVGVSALQALEQHIKLQKGQKILIHGGSGGIGSIAIQLARHIGAHVITTASGESESFVKSLGADEFINYKTQDFSTLVSDIDAVFDTAGGETTNKSIAVLKKGGILVTMSGKPDEELVKKHEVIAIAQNTDSGKVNLTRLVTLVESGIITPQVDKIFSLDESKEAFIYQEKEHPKGKVVVTIK